MIPNFFFFFQKKSILGWSVRQQLQRPTWTLFQAQDLPIRSLRCHPNLNLKTFPSGLSNLISLIQKRKRKTTMNGFGYLKLKLTKSPKVFWILGLKSHRQCLGLLLLLTILVRRLKNGWQMLLMTSLRILMIVQSKSSVINETLKNL